MKRSWQEYPNVFSLEQNMREKASKDLKDKLEKDEAPKFFAQKVRVDESGNVAYSLDSLPKDMIHLGGENFVLVAGFLGQTRVHIRRHVADKDGFYHPTKDGVSLSPKVCHSFCGEVRTILNHKSAEKVFIIDKDLCVSKKMIGDIPLFIFQRLFQRKNLSMQFVPELIVLRGPEIGKLADTKDFITDCMKEGLITYTLSYFIDKEIRCANLIKPNDISEGFLQLIDSIGKCLCVAITLKITELINCTGCRDSYEVNVMHVWVSKSRTEKCDEYFDQALYLIDMKAVAKDVVLKNLNIDYGYVLGQQEFFDALDIKGLFKSIHKMYIGEEEENVYNDLMISCS